MATGGATDIDLSTMHRPYCPFIMSSTFIPPGLRRFFSALVVTLTAQSYIKDVLKTSSPETKMVYRCFGKTRKKQTYLKDVLNTSLKTIHATFRRL